MPDTNKPIDFNNLDEAKKPSKENSGFSAMDTVKPEADENTKTTGDAVETSEPKHKAGEVIPSSEVAQREENKLPPAKELEAEEEDPEQRKIAGEAPYVTAANPNAFSPEVEGGVVTEDGKSKKEAPPQPTDNSIPEV